MMKRMIIWMKVLIKVIMKVILKVLRHNRDRTRIMI